MVFTFKKLMNALSPAVSSPKFNSDFIVPYAAASVLATCKYDSIYARFVVKVALTLAFALLTTTGAAIYA